MSCVNRLALCGDFTSGLSVAAFARRDSPMPAVTEYLVLRSTFQDTFANTFFSPPPGW
jgi:hypothetical protein